MDLIIGNHSSVSFYTPRIPTHDIASRDKLAWLTLYVYRKIR